MYISLPTPLETLTADFRDKTIAFIAQKKTIMNQEC